MKPEEEADKLSQKKNKQYNLIKNIVENIEQVNLDLAAERVCKRIRQAMETTGYPQKYFTEEGSEFQEEISKHMKKEDEEPKKYSEVSVKNFLRGDFGKDKNRERFIRFLTGAVAYFNLANDVQYLFDRQADENKLSNIFRERWREKNQAYEKLFRRMEPTGELFRKKLGDAKRISLLGISLHNTIGNHKQEIENSLKKGGEVRVIIINPDSAAIHECSFRSSRGWAEKRYMDEIEKTLGIAKNWMELRKGYRIRLRFIDHLPSYAITIIEPKSDTEKIHCHARLLPFRSTSLKGPSIHPDPGIHKEWFDFFCGQYETIWNAGKIWEPVPD